MKHFSMLVAATMSVFAGATLATSQELIDPPSPGVEGTVTVDQLTSYPMPYWAPLYGCDTPGIGKGAGVYNNFEMVSIAYATDDENVAALLPEGLVAVDVPELPGQSPVFVIFANYNDVECIGPYNEMIVSIPIVIDDVPYFYVPAIYVTSDSGMAAGREYGGYPKKIADIEHKNFGDWFLTRIAREADTAKTKSSDFSALASASVRKGGRLVSVPLPAEDINALPYPYSALLPLPKATGEPQPYALLTVGLRNFPGVGERSAGSSDVLQLVATPWVVTEAEIFEGLDASLDIRASERDPIANALPINSILGSFIIRGDLFTDAKDWILLRDYLAQ